VDDDKFFYFDSKLVRRVVERKEEEIVGDCEEYKPLPNEIENEDETDKWRPPTVQTFVNLLGGYKKARKSDTAIESTVFFQ
jgi:hypothetical protein